MSITIKTIPTLENEEALAFVKNADEALKNRGTINFTQQVMTANNMLAKRN